MSNHQDAPFTVHKARYAKGMMAVRCESVDGYKTRAMRLCEALRGRWTHREGAYIMSSRKAERLADLFAKGWTGSYMSAELVPPGEL